MSQILQFWTSPGVRRYMSPLPYLAH